MNIHQTFHGYENGHKLLGASCDLPSSTKRQLLLLSDMSGPGMVKGFESYLTGYPLSEIGAYAFARTWYATEMKRPGCVWTHTLLIPFVDLDDLCSAHTLFSMFRKPSQNDKWGRQIQSIKFVEDELHNESPKETLSQDNALPARTFLQALYGNPEKAVIGFADESSIYENLVINIWAQQWPRLRRNFTFCTGALAPRLFVEEPFDLQIAPPNASRTFAREPNKFLLVQSELANKDIMVNTWVRQANQDLLDQLPQSSATVISTFRSFLWKYSTDIRNSRSSFAPLAQIYGEILSFANRLEDVITSSNKDFFYTDLNSQTFIAGRIMPVEELLKELIIKVARAFPNPNEAKQLKSKLLGPERYDITPDLKTHIELLSEEQLLYCLATTEADFAYDANVLNIYNRATLMAQRNAVDAGNMLSLLLHSRISPFAEKVFAGILAGLDEDTVLDLSIQNPQLIPVFVSTFPNLANIPQVWVGSASQQQEIMDVLFRQSSIVWAPIVTAILEARADKIAQDLLDNAGSVVVSLVLGWLNQDHRRCLELSEEWQRVLKSQPLTILDWLKADPPINIETLAFVANLLDPHSSEVRNLCDTVWLRLAESVTQIFDQEARIQSAVFLLSVAFYDTNRSASILAANAFQIVYDAASRDKIPQSSWRLIAHQVPNFHGVKDWDKCERLLQALANNARVFGWPAFDLLKAVPDEQAFNRIVNYCREFSEGRQFLKELDKQVYQNTEIGTPYQRRILSRKNVFQRIISW